MQICSYFPSEIAKNMTIAVQTIFLKRLCSAFTVNKTSERVFCWQLQTASRYSRYKIYKFNEHCLTGRVYYEIKWMKGIGSGVRSAFPFNLSPVSNSSALTPVVIFQFYQTFSNIPADDRRDEAFSSVPAPSSIQPSTSRSAEKNKIAI